MTHVYYSRVGDTSQTTGLGPIGVLGIAPQINLRPIAQPLIGFGDSFYAAVVHRTKNEWEEGIYTYTGVGQLSRTNIIESSNNGAPVNFSPGVKDVFITMPAIVAQEADAAANSASGIAIVDFGALPGSASCSVVINDAGIASTSAVEAWIIAQATTDHSADEHWIDGPIVTAGNITQGSGFTIYAVSGNQMDSFTKAAILPYGKWNVGWTRRG